MAPIIGITTYARDDKGMIPLPEEYVSSVRRAGGIPILVPPGETHIDRLLSIVDGLVLAGGGDIDPALYGGENHQHVYMIDAARDRMEIDLANLVIEREIPTLAICRGAQIINVALGGTLFEHIPDHFGENVLHRLPPREPVPHRVHIETSSRLAVILDAVEIESASWHHQAIRNVGRGLQVTARAADNVIEAVELATHPLLVAVQWHPELTAKADATQQRLFAALIEAAC